MRSLTYRVLHDPAFHANWHAVRLMLHLESILDHVDPRPVKSWALAAAVGCKERTVRHTLRALAAHGYLVRDRAHGGRHGPASYRLTTPPPTATNAAA